MGEKKLKLQGDFVLIGGLEFYFKNSSCTLYSSYEQAKKEDCFDEDNLKIIIFGRIWSPRLGGGFYGSNMSLVKISFERLLGEYKCTYSPTNELIRENIFCKKFLVLLLDSIKEFRNSNLSDLFRDKSIAFNEMLLSIEDEIATLDYIVKIERFFKKARIKGLCKQEREDIKSFVGQIGLVEE